RIMRALILRRVGLLETGAGRPVILGRPGNGDVLRLEGFLRRNGHPRQMLDPKADPEAKALIERFHIDPGQLPIVLCPSGQLLRNPSEHELANATSCLPKPSCSTRAELLAEYERRERAGPDFMRQRPGSVIAEAPLVTLDRNERIRLMGRFRALTRRSWVAKETGRHRGVITR